MSILLPTDPRNNRIGLLIAAVLFVTVLVLSFVTPNSNSNLAFRVFLALFAALIAVYIPGSLGADLPGGIRATGAIAIFIVVYFFNPGERLRAAMAPHARGPARSSTTLMALLTILLGTLVPGPADATKAERDWVVVFDFVQTESSAAVSRTLSFDPGSKIAAEFLPNPKTADLPALHARFGIEAHRTRWIGKRGEFVSIFVRRLEKQEVVLKVEELPRDTQFASDIAKLVRSVAGGAKILDSEEVVTEEHKYELARSRATLKITVTPKKVGTPNREDNPEESGADPELEEDGPPSKSLLKVAEEAEPEPLTVQLLTGPREHLYLSTGVPLKSIDEVKVDDTSTLVPSEVPKKFLIGLHWQVGDILSSDHQNGLNGFNVGFMLQADSKPLEHAVVAVGYRMPESNKPDIGLQYLTPFVGIQRAEKDELNGAGDVEHNVHWQAVWGISLNLDKALGWLKPE